MQTKDITIVLKEHKVKQASDLMRRMDDLKRRITKTTGKWDSAEVIRRFRYAHK